MCIRDRFIVKKRDGGNRPVINLKRLNCYIPYQHFKMEGLNLIKDLLREGDYMVKLDLKDAYFSAPLENESKKYVRFQWKGETYQLLCLCFGLGPAPRFFTKLIKIPIAIMRKLNVRLIVYLDDILLMASTVEEILMARDTLIFLFQNLGFLIKVKKSQFHPCLLYTSPSPRDKRQSRMPSSA